MSKIDYTLKTLFSDNERLLRYDDPSLGNQGWYSVVKDSSCLKKTDMTISEFVVMYGLPSHSSVGYEDQNIYTCKDYLLNYMIPRVAQYSGGINLYFCIEDACFDDVIPSFTYK